MLTGRKNTASPRPSDAEVAALRRELDRAQARVAQVERNDQTGTVWHTDVERLTTILAGLEADAPDPAVEEVTGEEEHG